MSEAWEASNKTLKAIDLAALSILDEGLNRKLDGNGILFSSVQYSEGGVSIHLPERHFWIASV